MAEQRPISGFIRIQGAKLEIAGVKPQRRPITVHQRQQALEREIAALPERQRTALNLCFDEGLSNQDAADVMGVNLKALQSLIMRAKTTLKERMKNYF